MLIRCLTDLVPCIFLVRRGMMEGHLAFATAFRKESGLLVWRQASFVAYLE